MTDTDNPVLRSFGEDALKAAIDQTDAQRALDTPASRTLHWLNNSILHKNGSIFVTYEHHKVIETALQRMITPPASPSEAHHASLNGQAEPSDTEERGIDAEAIAQIVLINAGSKLEHYMPYTKTKIVESLESFLKDQGYKIVRDYNDQR